VPLRDFVQWRYKTMKYYRLKNPPKGK